MEDQEDRGRKRTGPYTQGLLLVTGWSGASSLPSAWRIKLTLLKFLSCRKQQSSMCKLAEVTGLFLFSMCVRI